MTYKVETATRNNTDMQQLLDLFDETLRASPYPVKFDSAFWQAYIESIFADNSIASIILLKHNDKPVGVLVGTVYNGHPLIGPWRIAMEMFWYVQEEHRGRGSFKMLELYEKWATEVAKCEHMCTSLLDNQYKDKLDRIYRLKGYKPLETQYIKATKDNA